MNIKELLMESTESNKLSLGRVMAWLVFAVMMYYWLGKGIDIPENMLYIFGFLMSYNISKKFRDVANGYIDTMSAKAIMPPTNE